LKLIGRAARWGRRGELPEHSIAACLSLAGAKAEEVDCVAIVRPISAGPAGPFHLQLRSEFPHSRIAVVEHHNAHAAAPFIRRPSRRPPF